MNNDNAAGRSGKPTIGVLVDWAGNPFGIKIWTGITDYARKNKTNVLCFVGGAINTPYKYERQRNALFRLINKNNIDGLIVLTTLIDNFVKAEELNNFFAGFRDFPVVSVGREIESVPSVLIDNAFGMKELMHHLIEADGYRRLAFIAGPDNKSDAVIRFQVFMDILDEYKIPIDPELIIHGKYDMISSQLAVLKLLDDRQISFDAIVAANDAMALGAIAALSERGIHVPQQVAVVGFDDFESDLAISPPLTTVRQPLYEVGWNSAKILLDKINSRKVPQVSIFKTELVLRESCGCFAVIPAEGNNEEEKRVPEKTLIIQDKTIFKAIRNKLSPLFVNYDAYNRTTFYNKIEHLLDSFYKELTGAQEGLFLAIWNNILLQVVQAELKITIWRKVLSTVYRYGLPLIKDQAASIKAKQLVLKAKGNLEETEEKIREYRRVRIAHETLAIRALGDELFTSVDLTQLQEVIERNFPSLGITSCYLCLANSPQGNDSDDTVLSKIILAYNEHGRIEMGEEGILFDSSMIIPGWMLPEDRNYSFMVDTLYHNNNQLGYVLLEIEPKQSGIYEILSRRLRNALKGVLLLQQLQNQANKLSRANRKLKEEIQERKKAEAALRDSEKQLKAILESCPIPIAIYRAVDGVILYTNKYFSITFAVKSRITGKKKIFDFYKDSREAEAVHKKLAGNSFKIPDYLQNNEINVKKSNGQPFTVIVTAEPTVFDGAQAIIASFYDITDRKRLEKEILEISGREQQRIGEDLHDGVGQQLTGIGYLCKFLESSLEKKGLKEVEDVREISRLVYQTISETRNLSQSLFPVNLEKNGIVYALQELAEKTENQYKLSCLFEYKGDIVIYDNSVALHLYRIAQEAVHNAVKHANPANILISLTNQNNKLILRIEDDGIGLHEKALNKKGMGLHIIQYRCNIINGKLWISRGSRNGTVIECSVDSRAIKDRNQNYSRN